MFRITALTIGGFVFVAELLLAGAASPTVAGPKDRELFRPISHQALPYKTSQFDFMRKRKSKEGDTGLSLDGDGNCPEVVAVGSTFLTDEDQSIHGDIVSTGSVDGDIVINCGR